MPTTRTTLTALVTFTLLVLTAGCTTGTQAAAPSAPASTIRANATPSPDVTTAAPAPVAAGDVLTDAQATALPEGVTAYALTDGSKVAVIQGQPLPDTVKAVLTSAGQAAADANSEGSADVADAARAAGIATGRRVIFVFKVYARWDHNNDAKSTRWITSLMNQESFDSVDACVASVAAMVASAPANNELIILK